MLNYSILEGVMLIDADAVGATGGKSGEAEAIPSDGLKLTC